MSKLFNSDDDDFGYLDDSIHINWKKLLPAIIIVAAAVIALIIVLIAVGICFTDRRSFFG